MSKIATTEDLDKMRCHCGGGSEGFYLHSACHPKSPTWCIYHPEGYLLVECAECKTEIVKIAVGK